MALWQTPEIRCSRKDNPDIKNKKGEKEESNMNMRRRNVAALSILLPVLLAALLYGFLPEIRPVILGYIPAATLVFKNALLSFASASKLKLIAYFKSLTFLQGAFLLIKRWLLDNVVSKWFKNNILDHFSGVFAEAREYCLSIDGKRGFKAFIIAAFSSVAFILILYGSGYLEHLFLFTELKVIVISLSKTVLLITDRIFSFLFDSWLTPLFEVFAFSWFFEKLDNVLGSRHPINRFLDRLSYFFGRIFAFVTLLAKTYFYPLFHSKIPECSRKLAEKASEYIHGKKIALEMERFDRLERSLLQGHINAYQHFGDMEKIRDKRELYRRINQSTADGIDIVAFVSRDSDGRLMPTEMDRSYYHDVFLMEGPASSQSHGVRKELENAPDYSDFWIMNTSLYPAVLCSKSGIVPPVTVDAQSLRLIKLPRSPDYQSQDLCLQYKEDREDFVPIR
jgi:hypothetical protein